MVTFTLSQSEWEFAKSRAIRAMCASVVYVPTCQTHANLSFLRANVPINVPTCQRCADYSTWRTNVPKAYQFFNYFSKELSNFWIFQLCSIFANFKNIWAILQNLSWKTKNLNFDICKISLRKNLGRRFQCSTCD